MPVPPTPLNVAFPYRFDGRGRTAQTNEPDHIRDLVEQALTHSSVGEGARPVADYEQLEFLGDRVLGLIVADLLVRHFPGDNEGDLSKRLNALVMDLILRRISARLLVWQERAVA